MFEILTLTLCQQPGMGSPSRPCKVKTEVKKKAWKCPAMHASLHLKNLHAADFNVGWCAFTVSRVTVY